MLPSASSTSKAYGVPQTPAADHPFSVHSLQFLDASEVKSTLEHVRDMLAHLETLAPTRSDHYYTTKVSVPSHALSLRRAHLLWRVTGVHRRVL